MYETYTFSTKKKAVSVIIPCYNAEDTILSTLESLEKQTFANFEVVIVNDGSTDMSHDIIKRKSVESKLDINYIIQENSGVSITRNRALKEAKGEYVVFLDADDVYHKDYIKILYNNITNNKVDTVVCSYTRNIKNVLEEQNQEIYNVVKLNHDELLRFFMYRKGPSAFVNFIYRKRIIDEYQISFNPSLKYGEDLEFIWKYLTHSKSGLFVDKSLYGYYDNPNSVMNNVNWRITDVLLSVKNIEKYLLESNDKFYHEYKKYMFSRTLWAVLKDFSYYGNKEYFLKACYTYEYKTNISNLYEISNDWRIKLSSKILCINKRIFFYIFKTLKFIKLKNVVKK